jgi:serine/threonine protein kinase
MPIDATRVEELVEAALEKEPNAWPSFLDEACLDDPNLRAEVASLLGYQEKATSFIEAPAYQAHAEFFADDTGELKEGEYLGEYKILSLLGEGGMGEVYLAEDETLGRKVAVKLVKLGLNRANLIRHFRQEERILAGLNDPHIARLYGGAVSANGVPYFVMEYVEGERVDDYCKNHQLSIPQRIQLFRKVCAAVSYAHQRLVIHRDLKPANIRVTTEGEPKLLDFGIAKVLDDQTTQAFEQTITLAGVMTPDYASPEQILGEPMTTASDTYSLGVILYELLTGGKPYKITSRTPAELSRAITEQEPPRPSAVVANTAKGSRDHPKLPRGDLDNIVLMAMRKEAPRRYSSVAQLSDDLRRYLEGMPVVAHKDSLSYRGAKFIHRHRMGALAALLLLLAIGGGVIATIWQARVAQKERAKAQDLFNDVRQLANSFMFEFHDSIQDLPGATVARALVVKRALEYIDRLSK